MDAEILPRHGKQTERTPKVKQAHSGSGRRGHGRVEEPVHKLEYGERPLKLDYIERAARAFKVSPAEVIGSEQPDSIDYRLDGLRFRRPDIADLLKAQIDAMLDVAEKSSEGKTSQ